MADEPNNWSPQGDQNAQPQNAAAPQDTQETQNFGPAAPAADARGEQPTESIDPSAVQGAQAAAASGAAPTATFPAADPGEVKPDYASAKGEQTVVSSAKGEQTVVSSAPTTPIPTGATQASQPAYGQYRPAPEYGAYGLAPTQPLGGVNGQTPNAAPAAAQPRQDRNPYFTSPSANNPFTPQSGQPTPTQSGQQNPNQQQPNQPASGSNGQIPPQGPFGGNGNPFAQPNPGQPGRPGRPGAARPQASNGTVRGVVIGVVAALLSAALCLGVGYAAITSGAVKVPTTSSLANVDSSTSGSGSATAKSGEAPDWQAVAKAVSGSVVSIQTQLSDGSAQGSGAILDTEGHIVTNNHVISGAQQIQVTLSNGQMYSAQVVGTDTTTDLAVIKLDNPPSDLKAVEFADSDKLAVGENIMAVGNPLGYDDTATSGIVSALNRPVTVMDDNNNDIVTNAVQIDAAINPGNSGGPTFNAAGQVIGINSSIASTSSSSSSSSSGSIGIGFAIPSNLVKRVANEIISNGSVKHVALGITITSSTVEADGVTRAGAKITKGATAGSAVVSGSPADKAGLKEGDVIVAFNGNAVSSNASLLGFVRAAALGDKATLTVVRDGKTIDVDVTLDQQEDKVNGSNRSESSNGNSQDGNGNSDGNSGNGDSGSGSNGFPFNMW
ncbi:S1C family serine protease [Bifidobacterium platyrrhinorum]|uniref:PDZ domain-containing protein n=1 Tax=Bifidobacterium platyrrhinorum TaxID=2661628 RepID=A0A6L9STW6_9BIFI|nr:trypsin-like peptidase domain-containing protein [Bifidobacterium platyrrhinorum]NEG56066.1 PDZ domain-containing protein [Bifidobacterium platyrrhinorum]